MRLDRDWVTPPQYLPALLTENTCLSNKTILFRRRTKQCHGKCQFQRCDFSLSKLPSEKHKGSESYVYNPPSTTTSASTTRVSTGTTTEFSWNTHYYSPSSSESRPSGPTKSTVTTTKDWSWLSYYYNYYTTKTTYSHQFPPRRSTTKTRDTTSPDVTTTEAETRTPFVSRGTQSDRNSVGRTTSSVAMNPTMTRKNVVVDDASQSISADTSS